MTRKSPRGAQAASCSPAPDSVFTEAAVWEAVGDGWRTLHGSLDRHGFSVEWHDFLHEHDLDVSGSYHPGSVEICLNVAGCGEVRAGRRRLVLQPGKAGFYGQTGTGLRGTRFRGGRHQFLTLEFSRAFMTRHLLADAAIIHPCLRSLLRARQGACVSEASRLTAEHQELVRALQHPPANAAARRIWSQAKALEVAATLFYPSPVEGEQFCERMNRINRERVQAVLVILRENLAEPPSLTEIGRRVGCSHFHLSRIFSEQMGCGIFQHMRTLRLERAAELIRRGEMKITDVAFEVGYASPSHFTTAFREAFGCCPGLYPLRLRSEQVKSGG